MGVMLIFQLKLEIFGSRTRHFKTAKNGCFSENFLDKDDSDLSTFYCYDCERKGL